ncbi:MAG: response regulator [Planctomycetes bacterium]|nr:response regulator [Planctomycetota bacterium]
MSNTIKRILIVDDNEDIHADFNKALMPKETSANRQNLNALAGSLFEEESTEDLSDVNYHLDHAYQGEEAVALVRSAEAEGKHYSLVFMDVRMPPGMDGIRTIQAIWSEFPNIEMVICTAYSDYSWDDIINTFGNTDKLLFLKKPFEAISVQQMAVSLTTKWDLNLRSENYARSLETEVQNRTKQLEHLVEELKEQKDVADEASQAKTRFLAAMSHEIRTPLNGIMGMNDLMLDSTLDTDQRNFSEIIKESSEALMLVINDILDLSKLEAGKIVLESIPFTVCSMLESVAGLFASRAQQKGVDIVSLTHYSVPDRVIGDAGRVRQILLNLCSNAIKFTNEGEICISVQQIEKRDGQSLLEFCVSDTGIGIPEEAMKSLFEEYSQAEASTARKFGGTGLGLNICKQLTSLMGGELRVKSEIGKGSEFTFSICLESTEAPHQSDSLPALDGVRVLVMGDTPSSQKVLCSYMESWGCLTHCSSSSEDMNLNEEEIDLIVVDYEVNVALAVVDSLRKKGISKPPVVFFTRVAFPGDGKAVQEAGHRCFLTKPIKREYLKTCIAIEAKGFQPSNDLPNMITKHYIEENFSSDTRVLLVEDNLINQKVAGKILERIGISYDIANNGQEAVDASKQRVYDLIFMDCMMPVMDGLEATSVIRKREKEEEKDKVTIVALTASVVGDVEKDWSEAGADACISKPISLAKMGDALKVWLPHED